MEPSTLRHYLERANSEGAKRRMLVSVIKNPNFTAASNQTEEYILIFDDPPSSPIDNTWPY